MKDRWVVLPFARIYRIWAAKTIMNRRVVRSVAFALSVFPVRLPSRELLTMDLLRTTKNTKDPSINQKLRRVPFVVFPRRRKKRGQTLSIEFNSRRSADPSWRLANIVLQTNTGRKSLALIRKLEAVGCGRALNNTPNEKFDARLLHFSPIVNSARWTRRTARRDRTQREQTSGNNGI